MMPIATAVVSLLLATVTPQASAQESDELLATVPNWGVARAQITSCATKGLKAYPQGAGQTFDVLNWRFTAAISDDAGLVLSNISLGSRSMAPEMRLPFYNIRASGLPQAHCHLKPDSKDPVCRSRLVKFVAEADNTIARVRATYVVDHVPADKDRCVIIEQIYEFHREFEARPFHCEIFGMAPCARFRPMVSYRAVNWDSDDRFWIQTAQRMRFLPDGRPPSRVTLGRDCEGLLYNWPPFEGLGCVIGHWSPVVWFNGNPLDKDVLVRAIEDGKPGNIDHFHQTPLGAVNSPGLLHFGCPECVHMHWRWSADIMGIIGHISPWLVGSAQQPQFGDVGLWAFFFGGGEPLIPAGSTQTVDVLLTQSNQSDFRSPDELLSADKPMGSSTPNFWYLASSKALTDRFFTHGGFFNSHGMNVLAASRGGRVESAPLFSDADATLERPGIGASPRMTAESGSEVIYHFDGRKLATFDLFCVTVLDNLPSSLKAFDLSAANAPDGPWRELGSFETKPIGGSPSPRSGIPASCQEFPLARTTARFLRMRLKSAHDGGPQVRLNVVRLYGFTIDGNTP